MVNDARAENAYVSQRDRNVLELEKKKQEMRLRACADEFDKTSQRKKKIKKVFACSLQFVLLLYFLPSCISNHDLYCREGIRILLTQLRQGGLL